MSSETTDPATPGRQRKRRLLVGALALAVLVAVGIVGVVVVQNRNADAPVTAVREYLDAIARGDAAAANALVDPRRGASDVDLDLLSNEMLASAKHRIQVDEVALATNPDLVSETAATVTVEYRLGRDKGFATLRTERGGTTAGVLHDWRVVDPLLVPIRVATTVATLNTARFGTAEVAARSVFEEESPTDLFLVYPAVYELRGAKSRQLTAEPTTVVADPGLEVRAQLDYGPTEALSSLVTSRIDAYAEACTTGTTDPSTCPPGMAEVIADGGTNLRIDRPSSVREIGPDRPDCDERSCELGVDTSTGSFSYTGADGTAKGATFQVFVKIVMTRADEVTIEFY